MKVFISWSGARSQTLSQALREWIPLVLHYADPWLSEADIAAGERWAQSVAKELEASNFGIICVTRENVGSPWILFEAGSLAKSLQGSKVIPLLLDLEFSEVGGPLAQFQAKKADKDGIREVVQSINQAAMQPIAEGRTTQLFEALWPQLEAQLQTIPRQPAKAKPVRQPHEVLEELVSGVRSLESRFKALEEAVSTLDSQKPTRLRRHGRFHPFMLSELSHMMGEKPGDPIGLLILASMLREDYPWLYEIGMEAYRTAKRGRGAETHRSMRRFMRAAEMTMRGPLSEEFGGDPRMMHMMMREIEHMIMREDAAGDGGKDEAAAPDETKG
jgi:TIR domain-containing protein